MELGGFAPSFVPASSTPAGLTPASVVPASFTPASFVPAGLSVEAITGSISNALKLPPSYAHALKQAKQLSVDWSHGDLIGMLDGGTILQRRPPKRCRCS
mmetsp:Transcript_17721/g.45316  ORF Transcript_17721/g.45316 Transcript_17721/m.45316 type:complete len:100 (-) Transcript_17721:251-550(-)